MERNRLAAAALSPNVLHPRRKNFTQKNSGGFRVTEERVGGYISGKNLSSQRQLVPVTSTCPGNVNLSRSRQLVPVTSAAPRNPSASQDTEHLSFCQTVLEKEAAYRATVRWSIQKHTGRCHLMNTVRTDSLIWMYLLILEPYNPFHLVFFHGLKKKLLRTSVYNIFLTDVCNWFAHY